MTLIVRYTTPSGIVEEYPDDYHLDNHPLITLVWESNNPGVTRLIHVPLNNIVDITEDKE